MMAHKGLTVKMLIHALVSVIVLQGSSLALASESHTFANGITAVVHSADEIRANPGLAGIGLASSERTFYPFDEQVVLAALESMQGMTTDVQVKVFILPAPPAQVSSSYASKNAIYLAPGTGLVAASTVAYITTHEMGHVLTWAFLDGDSARWNEYMDLRGLDAVANGPSASHADRAREIIAEDFRFLFGGALANQNNSIENHDLALPTHVFGLEEMLAGFVTGRAPQVAVAQSRAFPNPCNPRTTISLSLDGSPQGYAGNAVLRVFDIRGALVSTITGGQLSGSEIEFQWNGVNDSGLALASGRYLYQVQAGSLHASGSVTLVR